MRDLESYAGSLLHRVPLDRLLVDAETVLRAPQTLATWLLLVALLFATPLEAGVAACILFVGWSVVGSGFVVPGAIGLYRNLERVWLQGAAFVVGLSLLGTGGQVAGVATGLAGFVLLRWGIVARVFEPLARPLRSLLYRLPLSDQALRAVIVRRALKEGTELPQIDAIEDRMVHRMTGSSADPKTD